MTPKFVPIGTLIVLLGMATGISSKTTVDAAELPNDIQRSMMMTDNFPVVVNSMQESLQEAENANACYVEYQVTRRRTGRCIKLGRGISGCVSGQYLNPFHPDCL